MKSTKFTIPIIQLSTYTGNGNFLVILRDKAVNIDCDDQYISIPSIYVYDGKNGTIVVLVDHEVTLDK